MTKILIVDDDEELTRMMGTYLVTEGYDVEVVADGVRALARTSSWKPDLVLLDIVLGVEDGRELLRELRLIRDVPTIFLTGRGLESERIAGLNLGADDYVVKPFSLGELSARIGSVLRRAGRHPLLHDIDRPDLRYGELQINTSTNEVRRSGELVPLTTKEFSLLSFMASTPRQVYSRSQLLRQVWDSSIEWQYEGTVTEHIRRLRSKLEVDPENPAWIVTVRGFGYRFEPGDG